MNPVVTLAAKDVTGECVSNGQGVTPRSVSDLEIALEISAPNVVRLRAGCKGLGTRWSSTASPLRFGEPVSIQDP